MEEFITNIVNKAKDYTLVTKLYSIDKKHFVNVVEVYKDDIVVEKWFEEDNKIKLKEPIYNFRDYTVIRTWKDEKSTNQVYAVYKDNKIVKMNYAIDYEVETKED